MFPGGGPVFGRTRYSCCPSGYFLRNDLCVLGTNNVCICGNGVAAVGNACTDDDLEICVSCDSGYYRLFQGPKRSLQVTAGRIFSFFHNLT